MAPIAAEAMEESALGEDAGASAGDSDDSLQQSTVQLVETIDEPLTHDITGKLFHNLELYIHIPKEVKKFLVLIHLSKYQQRTFGDRIISFSE